MTKEIFWILIASISIITINCGPEEVEEPATIAVATLYRISNVTESTYLMSDEEIGAATFAEKNGIVNLRINVTGLTPNNRHAVHIHEGSCESPGSHWNQGTTASFCREPNLSVSDIWAKPKAGDVGNIRTDANGAGTFEISTTFWRLGSSDNFDITGLSIVIHENEEDFAQECFQSHSHIHDNPKIACGTIDLITP